MTSDAPKPARLASLDILRGAVMVLMAIDHVRVYSGVPAGGPTPGVFFTRWVTHFCAPLFVFLAGTGAYLHGRKLGDPGKLATFLLTRGLILVLLELTIIRFTWTFNLDYAGFTLAGVIWMLGWSMVLLAPFVRLSPRMLGVLGVAMIAFQQLFTPLENMLPSVVGTAMRFLYPNDAPAPGWINILYVIVPWVGVMAAGYGFGAVMERAEDERRKVCLRLGLGMTALFLVIGGALVLTQTPGNDGPPVLFRLLNQGKYPPTQLYLLMTLGPAIALIPWADRAQGWVARMLEVFGRAPMFYYLLHIPLIHLAALAVNMLRDGMTHQGWYDSAPYVQMAPEQRWSLGVLYVVWALCVALLYPACRWYARRKAEQPVAWMRYI